MFSYEDNKEEEKGETLFYWEEFHKFHDLEII